jgi:type III pantothenate kinase
MIVVSLGTAITVDAVSAEGVFLGGAIAPGMGAGRSALAAACDQLPAIDMTPEPEALPRDTESAVRAGVVLGAAGAVKELVARVAEEAAIEPRVVLTGGDAGLVSRYLENVVALDDALVLHGLRIAWEQTVGASR